jgi:putative tricarboxylic transport membrane protein
MFSPERLEKWPNVPTAREQGFDVTLEQHRGVVAAGGLTKDQALFWENAMVKLFQSAEFKKYMSDNGLRPLIKVGDEAEKYIAQQHQFYSEILTELGIAKKK